ALLNALVQTFAADFRCLRGVLVAFVLFPLSPGRPLHNQRMPLSVILSEVSNANEAEGSRTGSRTRTRYRFLVRDALPSYAKVSRGKGGDGIGRREASF